MSPDARIAQDVRHIIEAKQIVYDCVIAAWLNDGGPARRELFERFQDRVVAARDACRKSREAADGAPREERLALLNARNDAIKAVRELGLEFELGVKP